MCCSSSVSIECSECAELLDLLTGFLLKVSGLVHWQKAAWEQRSFGNPQMLLNVLYPSPHLSFIYPSSHEFLHPSIVAIHPSIHHSPRTLSLVRVVQGPDHPCKHARKHVSTHTSAHTRAHTHTHAHTLTHTLTRYTSSKPHMDAPLSLSPPCPHSLPAESLNCGKLQCLFLFPLRWSAAWTFAIHQHNFVYSFIYFNFFVGPVLLLLSTPPLEVERGRECPVELWWRTKQSAHPTRPNLSFTSPVWHSASTPGYTPDSHSLSLPECMRPTHPQPPTHKQMACKRKLGLRVSCNKTRHNGAR